MPSVSMALGIVSISPVLLKKLQENSELSFNWPKLVQGWQSQKGEMENARFVTARYDLALTKQPARMILCSTAA